MAWDIYGFNLREGYCEVHPDVPQPYPCIFCLQDIEYEKERHQQICEYDQFLKTQEDLYYNEMEQEYSLYLLSNKYHDMFYKFSKKE